MWEQNNTQQQGMSNNSIQLALKNGSFSQVYEEIEKIKIEITPSQARKLLELTREIKNESKKENIMNGIVKILFYLKYQMKRRQLKEEAVKEYEKVFKKALELCKEGEIGDLGKNLYTLIEMLTIHLYKKGG